nr:unnamed protein product [Naegleria fowleri]
MSQQQTPAIITSTSTTTNNGVVVGCQDSFIRMYHSFSSSSEQQEPIQPSGLLVGHTKPVSALDSISLEGSSRILSGGWDADIRMFDGSTMECLMILENCNNLEEAGQQSESEDTVKIRGKGHNQEVLALTHCKTSTPNEALIFSGGMDSRIKIWNLKASPDGKQDQIELVTTILQKEAQQERAIWSLTADSSLNSPVVYSSCLEDGMVRGYDVTTLKMVAKMKLHLNDVRHVKVANCLDSKPCLFTCSSDKSLKCVDLRANKVAMRVENISQNVLMNFILDDTSERLYLADSGGSIYNFDTRMSLKKVDEVKNAHRGGITKLVYNKGMLYSGGADKTLKAWNCGGGKKLTHVATVEVNDPIFAMTKLY